MTVFILNSATQTMTFLMVATDHLTGVTGQAPTVRFAKNGATTFSSATQAVTEMQYGWYKLTLATNNVDTMGELAVHATATKGDDTDEKHYVGPVNANAVWWASATVSAPAVSGVPVVDTAYFFGVSGTATTGKPGVNVMQINAAAATTNIAQLGVNVIQWATGTLATPNTTGVPKVDLISIGGTTATTGAAMLGVNVYSWATATGLVPAPTVVGRPLVDLTHINGSAATTNAAQLGVNVIQAATVGWNSGAIQSGTFAAEAITASALATDCITSSEIAASAVTEIQAGLATIDAAGVRTAVGLASANLDTQLTTIKNAATDIQTRLPAALVGGRIDASIGNVQGAAITATGFAAGAFTASSMATGWADKVADQVWDELAAGHTATTSFGAIVQAITGGGGATASDYLTTAVPGAYSPGSAGYALGTYLDATVSSRLASASYTAAPTAIQNADALLTRDMSAVTEGSGRTPLQALRFLRNKWTLATTGALTIFKEDDSTTSWSATATGDSAAIPVTGIDPA